MSEFVLLLQSGGRSTAEKTACCFSRYKVRYLKAEQIKQLNQKEIAKFVPVGTVEYIREYCNHMNIQLPESVYLLDDLSPFFKRNVREGLLKDANPDEFVKPSRRVKLFTGCLASEVPSEISPETPVTISDRVTFQSEYRFYIHDFVGGPRIYGWSRYDDKPYSNPPPDLSLVKALANVIHKALGPNAYSIDIGWVEEIQEYALVEINDAWALGFYENSDPNSRPPRRSDYVDMLVSRWRQILFCTLCG